MSFSKAVAGQSGEISLSFDPSDSFTTTATIFGECTNIDKTIQVPCVTLSEIFEEHHLKRCDLLKMDCEGSEYSILYNCPPDYLERIAFIRDLMPEISLSTDVIVGFPGETERDMKRPSIY